MGAGEGDPEIGKKKKESRAKGRTNERSRDSDGDHDDDEENDDEEGERRGFVADQVHERRWCRVTIFLPKEGEPLRPSLIRKGRNST